VILSRPYVEAGSKKTRSSKSFNTSNLGKLIYYTPRNYLANGNLCLIIRPKINKQFIADGTAEQLEVKTTGFPLSPAQRFHQAETGFWVRLRPVPPIVTKNIYMAK